MRLINNKKSSTAALVVGIEKKVLVKPLIIRYLLVCLLLCINSNVSAQVISTTSIQDTSTVSGKTPANTSKVLAIWQNIQPSLEMDNTYLLGSVSSGFCNLWSKDAYSSGAFGFMMDAGARTHFAFLPNKMFMESSLGITLLGNDTYRFFYIIMNILPGGIKYCIRDYYLNTQVGFSLLFGGGEMYIQYYYPNHWPSYSYDAKTNIAFLIKESMSISKCWDVGIMYMYGLNSVCKNLPIGLHHTTIQAFATFKFGIK